MSGVGVTFGGPSGEHDISILTGLQAARALAESGVDVCCLYWTKTGRWKRVPVDAEAAQFLDPEVEGSSEVELAVPGGFAERRRRRSVPLNLRAVLNCCHGGPGEDGSLAALLALAGLRVTGPGPAASALAMDKLATAALARSAGVPTIETAAWPPGSEAAGAAEPAGAVGAAGSAGAAGAEIESLPRPWVVKPRWGGSSIGVEAGVEDLGTVEALGRSVTGRAGLVVQPYLEGWIDLNVAVRTHPSFEVSEVERPLRGGAEILGYREKYLTGGPGMDHAPHEVPADIPEGVRQSIVERSTALARQMGLTGAPRIDFMWDGGTDVRLCEVNSIPGAWGNHLWRASGIARDRLYLDLIAEAEAGPAVPPQWSGSSDGQALSMSGTIAAKLA